MEDSVVTGVFKDGIKENLIVFSDEFFNSSHLKTEGANLLVTIEFADNYIEENRELYKEAVNEVKHYAEIHSQKDFFSLNKEKNLVFEKQEQLTESREEKLMVFSSVAVNMLLLLICVVFVFVEKMKSDEDGIIAKDRFCFLSGMTYANRKKNVRREIGVTAVLAAGAGLVLAVILATVQIISKHLPTAEWMYWYIGGIGIVVFVLAGIFAVMTIVEVKLIFGKAERINENGS